MITKEQFIELMSEHANMPAHALQAQYNSNLDTKQFVDSAYSASIDVKNVAIKHLIKYVQKNVVNKSAQSSILELINDCFTNT